jgi:hypothetical protein
MCFGFHDLFGVVMNELILHLSVLAFVVVLGCGGATKQQASDATVPKEDPATDVEPHAEAVAFILARCPHAVEVMRPLLALKRTWGDSLSLAVGYIGLVDGNGVPDHSLGEAEIQTAKIQVCVGMTAGDEEWLSFLECIYKGDRWRTMPAQWEECATQSGIDPGEIKDCLESGLGDESLAKSYVAAMTSRIDASPTVIINSRLYLGDRNIDSIQNYLCHSTGSAATRPDLCDAIEPPPTIAATLLYDSRCEDPNMCDVSSETALLEQLVPGLKVMPIDYMTDEGRHVYDLIQKSDAGVRELPLMVVSEGVEGAAGALVRIQDYVVKFGKGYLVRMGGGWDPTNEICDNKRDDTDNGKVDCADPYCANTLVCRDEYQGRVELFIMSGCPFATELVPSVDLFLKHFNSERGQVDFRVEFIGDIADGELLSMHGPEEVAEDLRMICAQDIYGKDYRFMEYVVCRAESYRSSAWEDCLPKWMSKRKLLDCAQGKQGRLLLEKSFELADKLGIGASPSWLLNGRFEMGGRNAREIVGSFCERNERTACKTKVAGEPEKDGSGDEQQCR